MTQPLLYFDVVQHRGYKRGRSMRLWVTNGELHGLVYRPVKADGNLFGNLVPLSAPLDLLLYGWAAIVIWLVTLPVALLWGATNDALNAATQRQFDALDPFSNKYMEWNTGNFLMRADDTRGVRFSNSYSLLRPLTSLPTHKLHLTSNTGESWDFTLGNEEEAEQLRRLLNEANFFMQSDEDEATAKAGNYSHLRRHMR